MTHYDATATLLIFLGALVIAVGFFAAFVAVIFGTISAIKALWRLTKLKVWRDMHGNLVIGRVKPVHRLYSQDHWFAR